jgi:hypothetical protein
LLKGDVHRVYRSLRRRWPQAPPEAVPNLREARQIYLYYAHLAPLERGLLLAWAKKEESGIGLIPLVLSGIPLISLIFSPLIQQHLTRVRPPWVWILIWTIAALLLIGGFYVHQRHRAYTTLHIHLLELANQGAPQENMSRIPTPSRPMPKS